MSPDDLLNPDEFPEDLQWLAAEFRLSPNDPVFLLIAWHWRRAQAGEDVLKAATLDLKSAIDRRLTQLEQTVAVAESVSEKLGEVKALLREQPLELGRKLEADLAKPVARATENVQALERRLAMLLRHAETTLATAQRRQAIAAFLIGMVLGGAATALCL